MTDKLDKAIAALQLCKDRDINPYSATYEGADAAMAIFHLFECDAMYDLACELRQEAEDAMNANCDQVFDERREHEAMEMDNDRNL